MMSESVGNRSQMEEKTRNGSLQEDHCGHSEIEFKMSVTVSKDWIKSLGRVDCEAVLQRFASEVKKQNSHSISIIPSDGTWRLEGCFSCIKEIRKALKDVISKKQIQENDEELIPSEGALELGSDQRSHQKNDRMETEDSSGIKPVTLMDNFTLGKVDKEPSEVGNSSGDQSRINEKLEFQQRKEDCKSNLKNGAEVSNSENSNNARTEKIIQRTVIEKSQKVLVIQHDDKKGVTNSGNSEGRNDLKKEGTPKPASYSENPKQQVKYPDLRAFMKDSYSEKERNSIEKSHEVKINQHEKKIVSSSHNSGSLGDSNKEGTSNDVRYSENLKQQMQNPDVPTTKDVEYRENLKQSAKFPDSTNSPALQESKTNDPEHDRICALMLLPSIDIDEDIFYYLIRCRNHELSRVSEKCNMLEPYKDGQGHKLAFDVKPQYDTDSVVAGFLELYEKTTTSRVDIPEGIDPESLKSLVEAMAEFKDVELRVMSQERVYKIAGSHREVTRAKEMLFDVIASNLPNSHGFDTTVNKKPRLNVQITTTPPAKNPTRTTQSYTASAASNNSQARGSVFTVINPSKDSFLLSASNSMTIEVKRNDLTRIHDADVLVSCINHQLDIDGPLADQIMRTAGPYVKTELLSLKYRQPLLRTGCLVHTGAGYLKGIKAIIHVVRPQLVEFPLNDQRSKDVLKQVFTNCLSYTNDVLKLNSICLPPIGFGLYGAEMVVDCFLDAVEMFASTVGNGKSSAASQHQSHPHHLNCIRLVTNEDQSVGELIYYIRRRLGAA